MEIEDFIEIIDPRIVGEIKRDFLKKYSFLIPKEILSQDVVTIEVIVIPDEEYKLLKMPEEDRFKIQYWRKFEVIWYYKTGRVILPIGQKNAFLKFDFWGIGYINKTRPEFSTEVIDPFKYHLRRIQEIKLDLATRYDLVDLWDYKDSYFTSGALNKFTDVCRSVKSRVKYNDYQSCIDIIYTNRDLKNTLSELLLYKNYIRDFTKDSINASGKVIYTYYPTFYDKNYFFLASQFIQTLCTYWDKIALLLHAYFPIKLDKNRVYFTALFESFPDKFKNAHYEWLLYYRKTEYTKVNKERRKIVHHQGLESQAYEKHLNFITDEHKITLLQNWKVKMVEEFIVFFKDSIIGLEEALKLVESKNNQNS